MISIPKLQTKANKYCLSFNLIFQITTKAINNLRVGGNFNYRMEAKDGSMGFDFEGKYESVILNSLIKYTIADGRKVFLEFTGNENETKIVEVFDAENIFPIEQQRSGWQNILNNFKKYAENEN